MRARRSDRTDSNCTSRVDIEKDQTYFLNAVPLNQLSQVRVSARRSEKPDVRAIAKRAGLHNHQRKDSTGICFIGERRFRDFLARYVSSTPGPIVGVDGCVHGEHIGLHHYTIGQREGLGIGGRARKREAPWYVVSKDTKANTLVVSQAQRDLDSDWLTTGRSIGSLTTALPLRCTAKVRYRQADQPCTLHRRADGGYWIEFASPQRAVTAGQYVCLYLDTQCLGGGVIEAHGKFAGRSSRVA